MSRNACPHCWGENALGVEVCRHCGQALTAANAPAAVPPGVDAAEPRGAENAYSKWALVGVVAVLALGSVLYRLLVWGRLEQTSMLFIGLPAVLAAAVALTPQAKSSTGMILKVMTLALLMSGVLLGEGFICILMAAPLFYGVGVFVGFVMDAAKRRDAENTNRRGFGLAALPLLLLFSFEGVHQKLSFPRHEAVIVERTVNADAASVERALSAEPRFDKALPPYLRLGFPRPAAASGHGLRPGDARVIRFAGGEGKPGGLVLEVVEAQPGRVRFRVLSDTSHISHWLTWQEAEVSWTPHAQSGNSAPPQTDVRWMLRYERRLDPAWYFAPWEHYAVSRAASYLIDTLATPHTSGEQDNGR